jgi:predicted Zn-ribbon and HTH transcriptional regulator
MTKLMDDDKIIYNYDMSVQLHRCMRCGFRWYPGSPELPTHCPKCNSPYWNNAKWKQSEPGEVKKDSRY